jgi:hypothetical protein
MGFTTKYCSGLLVILGITFSAFNVDASEVTRNTVSNISYIEPSKKTSRINSNEIICLAEAVYY